MKRDLYSQKLLISYDNFIQQMKLLDRADNPKLVFQLVMKWTKGQSLLTRKLLEYIFEFPHKIIKGREAITVERIIRNRLIKEFKKDELTLLIRKLLYGQDLFNLLKKTRGQIAIEQIYLKNLQSELGLTAIQARKIEKQCLQIFASNTAQITHQPKQQAIADKNQHPNDDSYQDLILLLEKSAIYRQLDTQLKRKQKKFSWSLLNKK